MQTALIRNAAGQRVYFVPPCVLPAGDNGGGPVLDLEFLTLYRTSDGVNWNAISSDDLIGRLNVVLGNTTIAYEPTQAETNHSIVGFALCFHNDTDPIVNPEPFICRTQPVLEITAPLSATIAELDGTGVTLIPSLTLGDEDNSMDGCSILFQANDDSGHGTWRTVVSSQDVGGNVAVVLDRALNGDLYTTDSIAYIYPPSFGSADRTALASKATSTQYATLNSKLDQVLAGLSDLEVELSTEAVTAIRESIFSRDPAGHYNSNAFGGIILDIQKSGRTR